MKETIYTIPINEAFDRRDGCPMCELSRNLERSSLDYIMGAAMMEPDVRIKTNEQGFCGRHLQIMLGEKNKLALALMLESHLPELDKTVFGEAVKAAARRPARILPDFSALRVLLTRNDPKTRPGEKSRFGIKSKASVESRDDFKKIRAAARTADSGCYICGRISVFMERYYENMLYIWKKEADFREKFKKQPFFCLSHYADLLDYAERCLPRNQRSEFIGELSKICGSYLEALSCDISEFCKSFDYRYAGRGMSGGALSAVERAVKFLTGG